MGWDAYCLFGSYKNVDRLLVFMRYGDRFIPQKLFGKYFNRVFIFIFGITGITTGGLLIKHFFDIL